MGPILHSESHIHTGAFTPGCQANHLPPYISKLKDLKSKGVDQVAVIGYNDSWVMNAWGKVNKVSGDDIVGDIIDKHQYRC